VGVTDTAQNKWCEGHGCLPYHLLANTGMPL